MPQTEETHEPLHENVTRSETEISLGWAAANPELFVRSVKRFQQRAPITDFRHHIDLSRDHFMKLIAVRRETPYGSVMDYVTSDDHAYLREIGYAV